MTSMTSMTSTTSSDIHQFWQENGYYVARKVFTADELVHLETDFDRAVSQILTSGEDANIRQAWAGSEMERLDGGQSVVIHSSNLHCFSPLWLRALLADRFLDVAEALVGPDIVLHHTKLFQKPAEKGSPFPMHQDWPYFPTFKDTMFAGIIHVSRATDEMGCLRVYPGSHRLGRTQQNRGQLTPEMIEKHPIEGATIVECEPGDVIFFHYFTLHGSMPNRSSQVRKTVLVQLLSGHDTIDPAGPGHPNERLALRGWNHTMTRSDAAKS